VRRSFRDCRVEAAISNDAGVENDEAGAPVRLCEGPRRPWPELAEVLRHLG
jgi:hypothetical protein